ncbi:sigma-70 family RNA polymerase sigma factor [Aeoliella sp. SH292]|uniref:sigma-70 family RNA polymerase sigma factor n=1 Tax=Aeoliella sp. SH292 TaxID=3454464 RepID=UPI003F96FC89
MQTDQGQSQHDEFLRLFSRDSRRIYNFVFSLVMSHADAEEVFQETCIVLWKKFDTYQPEGNFLGWACQIALYEVMQLRRKSKRLKLLDDNALEALADQAMAHSDLLNTRQSALELCIEKLAETDRVLIEQRYRQQRAPKEIAASLSRSVYSVYRALTRIHAALLSCVNQQTLEES